jgi:hypothetical protein
VVGREGCTASAVAQNIWCAGEMAHTVLICLRLSLGQQLKPSAGMVKRSTKRVVLSFFSGLLWRVPASPVREKEAEVWTASALRPLRRDSVVSRVCGALMGSLFNLRILCWRPFGLFEPSGIRVRRFGLRTALRRMLSPPSVVVVMDMT